MAIAIGVAIGCVFAFLAPHFFFTDYVVNYDMMVMIRLPYVAGSVEWVYKHGEVDSRGW
ncbi:hypothetical protein CsSME_00023253 [Camellia sinensis var. sinensis]